jgi:hypothetical protein
MASLAQQPSGLGTELSPSAINQFRYVKNINLASIYVDKYSNLSPAFDGLLATLLELIVSINLDEINIIKGWFEYFKFMI